MLRAILVHVLRALELSAYVFIGVLIATLARADAVPGGMPTSIQAPLAAIVE